ncbi:hypothetical protein B0H15DRAFT_114991 [Mycena belliarum]|uniref:Uncharacterized protein n=1 Tax=Mycena belliarum TaxID=1033014 RepID=A0AAD6TS66_9AGAR|nr:hypothetical protein B0H15DRAFT_114991 [Mycena belliae]
MSVGIQCQKRRQHRRGSLKGSSSPWRSTSGRASPTPSACPVRTDDHGERWIYSLCAALPQVPAFPGTTRARPRAACPRRLRPHLRLRDTRSLRALVLCTLFRLLFRCPLPSDSRRALLGNLRRRSTRMTFDQACLIFLLMIPAIKLSMNHVVLVTNEAPPDFHKAT